MVPCDTVFRYPDNPSTCNPLTLLIASRTQFLKEGGFRTFYIIRICAHQKGSCAVHSRRTSYVANHQPISGYETRHWILPVEGEVCRPSDNEHFSRSFDIILQFMKACGFIRSIFCHIFILLTLVIVQDLGSWHTCSLHLDAADICVGLLYVF